MARDPAPRPAPTAEEEHPLDNPLWHSLRTLHGALALGEGDLLRYPADVAPFLATTSRAPLSALALAALVEPGAEALLLGSQPDLPASFALRDLGMIVQMVGGAAPELALGPPIVALGEEHRAAVLELAALVYPHYFRARTMALGRYFGVFAGGQLVAMAGERMGMRGFREISAVCTHPDFVGRGLARRLFSFLAADIAGRGDTPFLHVSPDNQRARALYEASGFHTRRFLPFWSIRRA